MSTDKKIIVFLSMLLLSLMFTTYTIADGLSTTFSEVKVENLKLGQSYSLEKEADFPLEVKNTSDRTLQLRIDVLMPQPEDLKEGYEAIPDISWIKLEKDEFEIEPQKSASTDVIISVPDNKQYLGKKYQVYVWSHTVGESIGVGLRSRLLMEITEE